jgi:hypothetical protein
MMQKKPKIVKHISEGCVTDCRKKRVDAEKHWYLQNFSLPESEIS